MPNQPHKTATALEGELSPKQVAGLKTIQAPHVQGWTDNLTNNEYHEQKWAYSSTYLKTMFKRSQAAAADFGVPMVRTADIRRGSAIHTLVLEGEQAFKEQYLVVPPYDVSEELKEGKRLIFRIDHKRIRGAAWAVEHFADSANLLDMCRVRERSFFWEDPATGILCKARPDAYGTDYLVDLKTVPSLDGFASSGLWDWACDIQLAFYMNALSIFYGKQAPTTCLVIAVETEAPYRVGVYELQDSDIYRAQAIVDGLLGRIKDSREIDGYEYSDTYTGCVPRRIVRPPSWENSKRQQLIYDFAQEDTLRRTREQKG